MDYNDEDSLYAVYKIVLIGDSGVGKTNIVSRYTDDTFELETKSTIGVEFRTRTIHFDKKTIKLQIWDTAGQERYRAITSAYYRGALGIILAFDLTNNQSFQHLSNWLEEVYKNIDNTIIIIIGNKSDMKYLRTVKTEDGINFAKQNNCAYMETSALNGNNIVQVYEYLATAIMEKSLQTFPMLEDDSYDIITPSSNIIINPNLNTKKNKSCCN